MAGPVRGNNPEVGPNQGPAQGGQKQFSFEKLPTGFSGFLSAITGKRKQVLTLNQQLFKQYLNKEDFTITKDVLQAVGGIAWILDYLSSEKNQEVKKGFLISIFNNFHKSCLSNLFFFINSLLEISKEIKYKEFQKDFEYDVFNWLTTKLDQESLAGGKRALGERVLLFILGRSEEFIKHEVGHKKISFEGLINGSSFENDEKLALLPIFVSKGSPKEVEALVKCISFKNLHISEILLKLKDCIDLYDETQTYLTKVKHILGAIFDAFFQEEKLLPPQLFDKPVVVPRKFFDNIQKFLKTLEDRKPGTYINLICFFNFKVEEDPNQNDF